MVFANEPRFLAETDAKTLQNAINEAANHPSRTVCISARTGNSAWVIDQTLLLPSHITVILENCRLVLADGVYQNIFRNRNMYAEDAPLEPQQEIHILGKGHAVLDGGTPNDLCESTSRKDGRPHVRFNNLILLHNVTKYSIKNITCRNMRYWAINQIACTHGRIENVHFESGTYVPNQDGINFRIGCSHCSVENITGQTGDDTVALSAFPCGSDGDLLPKDVSPDIHDITIHNVSSCTKQTVVALRCSDGAKLYNVTIENITDNGGDYRPWGVVRIGENAYFRNRPTTHGDIHHIMVDGVRALAQGTVFLNVTLKDAVIRNVCAEGDTMYTVSTFYPVDEENPVLTNDGVTLENVLFENICYRGAASHGESRFLTVPHSDYHGAAFDFRCMRETDTFTNVTCRNVTWREDADRLVTTRPLNIVFE